MFKNGHECENEYGGPYHKERHAYQRVFRTALVQQYRITNDRTHQQWPTLRRLQFIKMMSGNNCIHYKQQQRQPHPPI